MALALVPEAIAFDLLAAILVVTLIVSPLGRTTSRAVTHETFVCLPLRNRAEIRPAFVAAFARACCIIPPELASGARRDFALVRECSDR